MTISVLLAVKGILGNIKRVVKVKVIYDGVLILSGYNEQGMSLGGAKMETGHLALSHTHP